MTQSIRFELISFFSKLNRVFPGQSACVGCTVIVRKRPETYREDVPRARNSNLASTVPALW